MVADVGHRKIQMKGGFVIRHDEKKKKKENARELTEEKIWRWSVR